MYKDIRDKKFASSKYEKEKAYWFNKLSGELIKTSFPSDFVSPGTVKRNIEVFTFQASTQLFTRLMEIINNSDSRLHIVLITALYLLLFKYTGNDDIIVCTPIDKQGIEGDFINTILPLRIRIEKQSTVKEFLMQVRQTVNEAGENQNYPIETLPFQLGIPVIEGEFPLFDTAIMLQNIQDQQYLKHINLNILFSFLRTNTSLEGIVEYNASIYKKENIERIVNHFLHLTLEAFIDVNLTLQEVSILSEEEKKLLVFDFNKTTANYPRDKMIHQLFEEQVERTPGNIAVESKEKLCTYKELNEKANRLARVLKEKGIGSDTISAIILESSVEVPLAIMAVLKAGGTYLPMGFEYPEERINYLLRDSGSKLLITRESLVEGKNIGYPIIDVDDNASFDDDCENLQPINQLDALAYIIYTSGTTGQPKGVMIEHKGLVNYIWWAGQMYVGNEKLDFPLYTSISFDLTVTSIFTPLITGNTIVVYGGIDKKLYIEDVIDDNRVGIVKLTPSHLKLIRSKKVKNSSIKRLIVGGEELETELAKDIYNNFDRKIEIYNEYGPTETVVGSMIYKYDPYSDTRYSVPIGIPIANTRIYLLSTYFQPVPVGVEGEIYIGGDGLARGYLFNPKLTEDKFIPDPFAPGEKMYKTGDLAVRLSDGNIEYKGRIDRQVKIRGYRVETGEIEAKIVEFQKMARVGREQKENIVEKLDLRSLKHCMKCLIPENYPGGIHFDEKGICDICREFETYKDKALAYFKSVDDFHKVVNQAQETKRSKYDCLMLYSGGKDSSYTLHRLVEMGLKVLAFTFDNGYISEKAFENIDRTTKLLNVDHIILDSGAMKEIFVESLWSDYNVCNGCFKAVNTLGTKVAHDHDINLVISGLTRGQIFDIKLHGLFRLGVFDEETIEERLRLFRKSYHSMTNRTSRLIGVEISDEALNNTYFVDYFRYDNIPTSDIFEYLKKKDKGWVRPTDTGASSSNCIINDVGIYVHLKDKGCHFYAPQLSWDCRLGTITRDEGLEEMWGYKVNYPQTHRVLNEIGYYNAFTGAVVADMKDEKGEKILCAYILADKEFDVSELKAYLSQELPDYMIPLYYTRIDRIPLTSSGKVDRKALPKPELTLEEEYVAPRNIVEEKLTQVWSEVLGLKKEKIGIDANFFEVGGHSLRATFLAAAVQKQFNVKLPLVKIFELPSIRGQAELIKEAAQELFTSIENVEKKEYYVLSSAQKRLYILQQLDVNSTAYNVQIMAELDGEIRREKLEETFRKLFDRHESLKTSFILAQDTPMQIIVPDLEFKIDYYADLQNEISDIINKFVRPFDLSKAPLIRIGLIEIGFLRHILMVNLHHIITDGISQNILMNDFLSLYNDTQLPVLKLQYYDYSEWQQKHETQNTLSKQAEYWLKKFEGEIPVLNLPTDYSRPLVQSLDGNSIPFYIDKEESLALNEIARIGNATLFMVLVAIYNIFLSKICAQENIIVGTPTAGRRHADLEKIVGMFVNTLALNAYPAGEKTFTEFLNEIREITIAAFENQDYQFEDLVDKLVFNRDMSHNPIFDTLFVLQNIFDPTGNISERQLAGLRIKPYPYMNKTAKFDLTLISIESEGKLYFTIEYCTRLFKKETIIRFIDYFKKIITVIINVPKKKISEIEIISTEDMEQLLYDFNNTVSYYPKDKTIIQLFEEQVDRTPDNIAVVSQSIHMAYRELTEQSFRCAHVLQTKGVGVDSIVGIMMERSVDLIIGIISILKSRGAYLPIDPDYPQERIDYMLKDSAAKFLVAITNKEGEIVTKWEGEKVLLDEILRPSQSPSYPLTLLSSYPPDSTNLAYIIYTSGSTGKPKGVLTMHCNATRVVKNTNYIDITSVDRILQLSNYAFDGSIFDIYGALLNGSALILIKKETVMAVDRLAETIRREQVTIFFVTTALFNVLVDLERESLKDVKKILFGGERVSVEYTRKALEYMGKGRIIHVYGPTETTVYASYYFIDEIAGDASTIPIGRPIANTTVFIVDKNMKLSPIGVSGEIYIGGEGTARGYLNNPELTVESFTKSFYEGYRGAVFSKKAPLVYKTGDLACWLDDGNIEFLGRIDNQIKIRGFRVELGEIENRISNYAGIKDAVVLMHGEEKGEKYLCAYVVFEGDNVISGLREYLSKELPDYMIPSYFVQLEKIPLTTNGKVDRKILPKPGLKSDKTYTAPRNEIETKLVELWAEILGRESLNMPQLQTSVGIDDNFFQLGGHSLKATVLAARIHKELNVHVPLAEIFTYPTIRGLAEYIRGTVKEKYESMLNIEEREYYELSSAQKRLYILWQMDKDAAAAYNINSIMTMEGIVDNNKLERAILGLIQRHESLRTSFFLIGEEPVQRIHVDVAFEIEYFDFTAEYVKNREEIHHSSFIIHHFLCAFDLSNAPLLRVGLVKLEENKHIFLVIMHHIISDGISIEVLMQDFSALYSGKELPQIMLQYKDYAEWQKREKYGKKIQKQCEYWKKEYEGEIPIMELPMDYLRPAIQAFEGSSKNFEINSEIFGLLKILAREMGATPYMVMLALYSILLSKLSNLEDIVVGTPTAGRRHADLEKIIGMFVNTLALRTYPLGEKRFIDFLKEVKVIVLNGFDNQEYQYEDLVEKLAVKRDASRNPLFDTMFDLQNMGIQEIEIPGLKLIPYEYAIKTSKFDLTLTAVEVEEKLNFRFVYSTRLFREETIDRFIRYFKSIVSGVIKNKERKIFDLEIITQEEKNRILYDFNNTSAEYPGGKSIHELFEEQAERTPDHIAVVGNGQTRACTDNNVEAYSQNFPISLSYIILNEESDLLAGLLIEKGVLADNIVAIMMERSIEMIIGIFGILKANGAYLPIVPEYPQERIDYMLKDSAAKIMIKRAEEQKSKRAEFVLSFLLSTSPLPHFLASDSSNLAYVIYTSGSTGKPKGVIIEHVSAVNLLFAMQDKYPVRPSDTYLLKTSYIFDVSVTELFGWYIGGGKLAILEAGGEKDPQAILESIEKNRITHINFVPSMFNAFISQLEKTNRNQLADLRYIFLAGEALLPEIVTKFRALDTDIRLENIYGPTEGTVYSSEYSLSRWTGLGSIPIGKPLPNIELLILDRYNQLQPLGIPGELYIGGNGLARGYLNNPELTNDRLILPSTTWGFFEKTSLAPEKLLVIPEPRSLPSYLYKTGDLVRWISDGDIEFLGRIDHQVKIRGYRIELGEIENHLLKHEQVKEVAILPKEDMGGDKYLVAYFVSDIELSGVELKEYLLKSLPDYMIPTHFVQLQKIPLTVNGKVDWRALPTPEIIKRKDFEFPCSPVEKKLAEIWASVLKIDKDIISINSNFFELGGHSLNASILVMRLHKELNVKFSLGEMFRTPTIKGIVNYISGTKKDKFVSLKPAEVKAFYALSSAQKRLYISQQINPGLIEYNMPMAYLLDGEIEKNKLSSSFNELIKRHDILRTSFIMVGEEPLQKICEGIDIKIEYYDISVAAIYSTDTIFKNFIQPFDLSKPPLMRVGLIKLTEKEHILLVDMHHIITDGVSMEIMKRDFILLYSKIQLPPLKLQYKDFSEWQNQAVNKNFIQKQEEYWLKTFEGKIPKLNLTPDFELPQKSNYEGNTITFLIPEQITRRLKDLTEQTGTTLFMFLVAALNTLLFLYTRQEDIIIGSPITGRNHIDLQNIIGMFVNMLALRNKPNGSKTFIDFFNEVKQNIIDAFENQDYQFDELVKHLGIDRKFSENPLFNLVLAVQNIDTLGSEEVVIAHRNNLKILPYPSKITIARFDITFFAREINERIYISNRYSTAIFKEETMKRFGDHYIEIIDQVTTNPDIKLEGIVLSSNLLHGSHFMKEEEVDFDF